MSWHKHQVSIWTPLHSFQVREIFLNYNWALMIFSVEVLYLLSELKWNMVKMMLEEEAFEKLSQFVVACVPSNPRCFSVSQELYACGYDLCHPWCFHSIICPGPIIKLALFFFHSQFSGEGSGRHCKMLGIILVSQLCCDEKVNWPDTQFKGHENEGMLGLRAQTPWDIWVTRKKKATLPIISRLSFEEEY